MSFEAIFARRIQIIPSARNGISILIFCLFNFWCNFKSQKKKSCALIRKTFSSRKGDDNLLRKMQYTYREEALRGELLLHFFDKLISNTALGFISLFCVGNEISHIIPWK